MVWVAGMRGPNRTYSDLQVALDEARRLRTECTTREVYVLAPTHRIDGRALLEIRQGAPSAGLKVAPEIRVKKTRKVQREDTVAPTRVRHEV